MDRQESATKLHERVPPGWYYHSIHNNLFQRYWHHRRFEEISKLIEKTDGEVLDVGCCDGTFTHIILDKTNAQKVVGIDVLAESTHWAKKHWGKNHRLKFMVVDAHSLPFKKERFNAVVALEVLEHVYEPEKVLKEMERVLKKGGYIVILVPNDTFLFKLIWFLWSFYRGKIWKNTHLHNFRDEYLINICQEVGLEPEKRKKFLLGMLNVVKLRKS